MFGKFGSLVKTKSILNNNSDTKMSSLMAGAADTTTTTTTAATAAAATTSTLSTNNNNHSKSTLNKASYLYKAGFAYGQAAATAAAMYKETSNVFTSVENPINALYT